jgi:hypothetical protein
VYLVALEQLLVELDPLDQLVLLVQPVYKVLVELALVDQLV